MVAICAANDYDNVLTLLNSARQNLGPLLSAFEVMWPDFWQFATTQVPGVRNPLQGDDTAYGAYVLIEALGTDPVHDAPRFEAWLGQLLESGVVPNAALAQSLSDGQAFWRIRDTTGELQPQWPGHAAYDIGLPVADMDAYVRRCQAMLHAQIPNVQSVFYGHIGDGNMHINVYQPGAPEQPKDLVNDIVYGLVREYGGTVSAEHGIGTLKRQWLGHARSPDEIELMRVIIRALDPQALLNPG